MCLRLSLFCDTSLENGDTSSSFCFLFLILGFMDSSYTASPSFIYFLSFAPLALERSSWSSASRPMVQQNIGSLYLSESCCFCKFFFWFFSGNWLLGITSHGIPSSAWGRDVKEQMTLEIRSSCEKKIKRSLQICYARHTGKSLCPHSPLSWESENRLFVSQPRMRNLQTVLLFCSVWTLLTLCLWGQAMLRTVVSPNTETYKHLLLLLIWPDNGK